MTEKELWALIFSVLTAGFTAAGYNATNPAAPGYVNIKQGDQPTLTGRPDGMAVLVSRISSRRYGWVRRSDVWDADLSKMVHTEAQKMETTFQVGALAPQNPNSPTFLADKTAADLVMRAAAVLQSTVTLRAFKEAGVGVFRVTDIREPEMAENDQDKFEATPSFDFTLNYTNSDVTEEPAVETIDLAVYRV